MQELIAWAIVVTAVAWLVYSLWRAATGRDEGCGGGCGSGRCPGCRKPPEE